MKGRIQTKIIGLVILLICVSSFRTNAQQVNTLYFMDNVPVRHMLNPAFQPTTHFYLGLPIIGHTRLNIGNNSISLQDVVYNSNGQTITFLDKSGGNVDRFYKALNPTTVIRNNYQINLISFGLRHNKSFFNFSLSEIADFTLGVPRDVFKLLLYGMVDIESNKYNFRRLQSDASLYTEAAFGYSQQLDKKWTVGAKLKFLFGSVNVSNTNHKMKMESDIEKIILSGDGSLNFSSPMQLKISNDLRSISLVEPVNASDWFRKPSGTGLGIDFGVDYKYSENLRFSAALTDLGFISWNKNVQNLNYNIDYTYDGIWKIENLAAMDSYTSGSGQSALNNDLLDSLYNVLKTSTNTDKTSKAYVTGTTAKLNLGVEYNILDNKLGFGLLSRSLFFKNTLTQELTLSVNARPNDKFNGSISYSFFDGGFNSIGAAVGLRTGFMHWFLGADYIPFQKSSLSLSNSGFAIPIPYRTKSFNFSFGANLVFDEVKAPTGLHKFKRKKDCNCN